MELTPPLETTTDDLTRAINDDLVARFGVMLTPTAIAKALSYPSPHAFRQAVVRGTIPVPIFRVPNRRGYFALARDVAVWLSALRRSAENSQQLPKSSTGCTVPGT